MSEHGSVEGIAIVGMAGRFPGAPDVDTLWSNLCDGVESVRPFTDEELRAAGADTGDPAFVNAGALMEGVEDFDAEFFGMGRREAELTDPQHRLVLETAWAALEHAGYDPETTEGRIGIFGGVGRNQYLRYNLQAHPELLARAGDYPVMLGNEREYAIMRAAFKLGFRGPAVSVNTACSTSGVAVHLAVQSLQAGDTDLALAGGARVVIPLRAGYMYQEGNIFSADGHVRAFDADARGTVIASGVAFVALKRLEDALEDADTVYAIIRGSAINNDGADRIGFTAPGVAGQADVVGEALAIADVDAESIGMVEAHGTGTLLGDPIEIAALAQAYRQHTTRRGYCAIGSLKSNIGHIDAGAGVAGIIKAALSLYHERIPPSINYSSPNPQIDFASSPFFVNTELRAWPRGEKPRRAGVSSFGLGGTNFHVVLEEAPQPLPVPGVPAERPQVLVLSAKTPEALQGRRYLLADHLEAHPEAALDDVAHTLAVGRSRMSCRAAVVAGDAGSAVGLLRQPRPHETAARISTATGAEAVFLFTGQGAQYLGMGAGLYRDEPVFAEAMQACARVVGDIEGHDLIDLLYGEHADTAAAERHLMRTALTQPAVLALQYGLARLWASWGVEPSAMVGHSVGEIAAACVGGVFALEDALLLAVARGRLMQDLPPGAMTAILAGEAAVLPLLGDESSLAAVNAPEQCVASGSPSSIDELEHRLADSGIAFRRLPQDRGFHSPMMEPVITALRDHVGRTARGELRLPMLSTMTGTWTTSAEFADPSYWASHARRTVRFADAVGVLLAERPDAVLIEIGPGDTLASLVRHHPGAARETAVVCSLPHRGAGTADRIHARRALADAWTAGVDVDWTAVNGGRRRRVALPTYPFARQRHWIEAGADAAQAAATDSAAPAIVRAPAPPPELLLSVGDADDASSNGTPRERIARQLISTLADLSGIDTAALDPAATFSDLGFDSLFLVQFNSQFRRQFGIRIPLDRLLTGTSSIDALAAHVEGTLEPAESQPGVGDRSTAEGTVAAGASAPDVSPGADHATPIPLLPNISRFMGERDTPHPEHWNVSALLTPSTRLEPETIRRVVTALLERHDALRLRISLGDDGYAASIAPVTDPVPFGSSDLSGLDPQVQPAAVERRADELQASLDLDRGPMIRVELLELGRQGQRLLVVVHHFAFDQLSWRPFWDDFVSLHDELSRGTTVSLPPPPTSFEAWAHALQRRAASDALRSEARIWRDLPWERVRSIPLDRPDGANTNASADHLEVTLSAEETNALLRRTPSVVRKADLIITALARTIASWTGSDTVLIDLMGHGRDERIADDVDPMESIGFYISYTPLVLRVAESLPDEAPRSLTDQIEPLLCHALDFDLLRYMASDAAERAAFRALPRAGILFNHHGKLDEPEEVPRSSMFRAAPESSGRTHSPDGLRYYPIAVSSKIQYGRLRVKFVYSAGLHDRSTIEALTEEFRKQLAGLVGHATT
jgi:non-ribosomal peptide synthase protein (TIGR01720 family)